MGGVGDGSSISNWLRRSGRGFRGFTGLSGFPDARRAWEGEGTGKSSTRSSPLTCPPWGQDNPWRSKALVNIILDYERANQAA